MKTTRTKPDAKDSELDAFRESPADSSLATNRGLPLSLKGGRRAPTLLEDFHLHEKSDCGCNVSQRRAPHADGQV
jgi:hypothetical protein